MTTVIDKLRVKGAPAPRNSPTSPLMATSRANRPIPNTIISLDKSYDIILKHGNKNSVEFAYMNSSAPGRRLEYLSRVQHANFGISTMDSPYCVSEDQSIEDKPYFVLCGQPVSGVNNKTFNKYISDQRTGNYKTSAKEMHRVKTTKLAVKAKSEPSGRPRKSGMSIKSGISKQSVVSEFRDNASLHSDFNPPPSSAISIVSHKPMTEQKGGDKSPFELTGRGFKGGQVSIEKFVPRSADFMVKSVRQPARVTRQENTEKNVRSNDDDVGTLRTCLQVNSQPDHQSRPSTVGDYQSASQQKMAFAKNGIRLFNNPYRHMKHRENVLMRDRQVDMKSVRKITRLNTSSLHVTNDKHFDFPRGILRVPNPCSDTFLLQMLLAVNSPKVQSHHQKSVTGKYSDIALQRDLDEYMVVRTPSSQSKPASGAQRSQVVAKSGKSARSNLDHVEEDNSTWAGNEIDEEAIRQP
ncbi:hypothetical protein FSP39_015934 [Pinctada imbricata]|uniref:Uncharacterized protein n=1 Tax=Pinctada imbricata TaxID=66713 RepID=A0AA88Y4S9_PINIB|nr:hypothetical protein FSP39_015934 [Pinctada imbricata]